VKHQGLAIGLGVVLFVLVTGGGFLWAQTRVIERPPTADEAAAMISRDDLVGSAGGGTAEELVRVFPRMPMLWLDYRRGGKGEVQVRSHLLRYDDVELARTALERFQEGDARWVADCATTDQPLPPGIDAGALKTGDDCFVLTARYGGTYVHVSAQGWAPESSTALGERIGPSLEALLALPWPPKADG